MIVKFFEELERSGYGHIVIGSDQGIPFEHVHMPNGLTRYFPVLYVRNERVRLGPEGNFVKEENGMFRIMTRVVTADLNRPRAGMWGYISPSEKGLYKAVVETRDPSKTISDKSADVYTRAEGYFDGEFNPLEHGLHVLQSCLSDESIGRVIGQLIQPAPGT